MPNDVQRGNDVNLCALAEDISTLPVGGHFYLAVTRLPSSSGHFIRGYGDSQKPQAELELLPGAVGEAPAFLSGKTKSRGVRAKSCPRLEPWKHSQVHFKTSNPFHQSHFSPHNPKIDPDQRPTMPRPKGFCVHKLAKYL